MKTSNTTKTMCYLLRHQPAKGSLDIDKYGYVDISKLAISLSALLKDTITIDTIKDIVKSDEKGRYTITNNRIKCNFGHSIPIQLEPVTNTIQIPDILYHGTAERNVASILESGIKTQKRQYVHLTTDTSVAIQVGMRYAKTQSKLVLLTINSKQMIHDGVTIHTTNTSTYLTEYVDPKYILRS